MESPSSVQAGVVCVKDLPASFQAFSLLSVDSLKPTSRPTEPCICQKVPAVLLVQAWSYLLPKELVKVSIVTTRWRQESKSLPVQRIWQRLFETEFRSPPVGFFNTEDCNQLMWSSHYWHRHFSEFRWTTRHVQPRDDLLLTVAPRQLTERKTLYVQGSDGDAARMEEVSNRALYPSLTAAVRDAGNFDRICLLPGVFQVENAVFINNHQSLEIVGCGDGPDEVRLVHTAFIVKEQANVRISNVTFVAALVTTFDQGQGWLQLDDCLLDRSSFVEISNGNEEGEGLQQHDPQSFEGRWSRCLFRSPTFPSLEYKAKFIGDFPASFNVFDGEEPAYGMYDVEFLEEEVEEYEGDEDQQGFQN